jgi:hypothetical protein
MKTSKCPGHLSSALRYARMGLPVFPCRPGGKEPLTPHGFKDATTALPQIRDWWGRWPEANLGLPTGRASGLVVLDIDPRSGGDWSWAALRAGRKIPKTVEQWTGGGGKHIVFRDPGSIKCRALAPGLEVKGEGGYVIVPSSVHTSGERYRFVKGRGAKLLLELAEVPDWLLSAMRPMGQPQTADATSDTAVWNEGERNSRLTSVAGSLRRRGCNAEQIEGALQQLNQSRCNPPLPEAEVRSIATGMERYHPADQAKPNLTQVSHLLSLAADAELFHTPDGEPYATVPVNGHIENWPLKSKRFRQWLLRRYHDQTQGAPKTQAVQEAIGILESRANFVGSECPVFVRLAEKDASIYLDLTNEAWEAIEIDADGWRVVSDVPVRFRRARGMSPLPHPAPGGDLNQLRRFVNVVNQQDWMLLAAWLVASVRPRGPFPILVLHGEQGSAKSTTSRVLRSLVDPNVASLRGEPRDLRDVMIAATNAWVISLDNLSRIPPWLSDALCRLATGGGFATRELYTDSEEALFDAQRPVILNGIEELATRGDLLDRALILYLPALSEEKRQSESNLWSEFELARPALLGSLLDAVSAALRCLPSVKLPKKPRMADFAVWMTAAEAQLGWPRGAFLDAYEQNRSSANALALEASPIAEAVQALAREQNFEGTATELLKTLTAYADASVMPQKSWPANAQVLSNKLRRIAPNLRSCGVEVSFSRDPNARRRRSITICRSASTSSSASDERYQDGVKRGKTQKPDESVDAVDAVDARSQPLKPARGDQKNWKQRADDLLARWQRERPNRRR